MYVLRSAKEDGSRAVTAAIYIEFWVHSLLFHKLSESLKTACNRVHYRITGLSQHLTELYIYIYLFHKLSTRLKIICNHVHYRITEIQAKFLNCQSFISSSINYHSSAKFSVTALVIALEKLLNLSLLTLSFSIKCRQDLKSLVTTTVIAFRKIQIVKKHLRNALSLFP